MKIIKMKIIKKKILMQTLREMTKRMFGDLVKAVVDTKREIMAIDAELHADEEKLLLENGSKQENLWGINIYPDNNEDTWIEFDSMINLRPSQNNFSRGVSDEKIQSMIINVVNKLVQR